MLNIKNNLSGFNRSLLFQKRCFSMLYNWSWNLISVGAHYPAAVPPLLPSPESGGVETTGVWLPAQVLEEQEIMRFPPWNVSLHTESSGFISMFSKSNSAENADGLYNSKHVLGKLARTVHSIPHDLSIQLCFSVWFVYILMELLFISKSVNIYCFLLCHKKQERNRTFVPATVDATSPCY